MAAPTTHKLDEITFKRGLRFLSKRDPVFAKIIRTIGPPPLWTRPRGFGTLVLLILEQQVSLASARATMDRLRASASPLTPRSFLELDDALLKRIGFSRQKAAYCRGLALAILDGSLNLAALAKMEDTLVRAELIKLKGIGVWTADNYLLMALRRPDAWPSGDLALAVAVMEINRWKVRPTQKELEAIGLRYKPWRAVAARLLWHYYLSDHRKAARKQGPGSTA
ncbi:MAG TPA: DNA-3-methyladenine glycosylase 2 family protein [Anaerolineae bacterium]